MQSHRIAIFLISFATVASLLVAFAPGLQRPEWHSRRAAAREVSDIPLLSWLASDVDAQPAAADPNRRSH